jgi:hypothetical protein
MQRPHYKKSLESLTGRVEKQLLDARKEYHRASGSGDTRRIMYAAGWLAATEKMFFDFMDENIRPEKQQEII